MQYKAIFFDMDGTLTSLKTHKVPDSTLEAIARAQEKGVKIFLATGRHSLLLINEQVNGIPFDGYITANGQLCYNSKEIIRSFPIPLEDKISLVSFLSTNPKPVMFQSTEEIYLNMVDERVEACMELIHIPLFPIKPPETCLQQDIYELLFFGDASEERDLLHAMPSCKSVRWTHIFTDVIPKEGGKDVGIDAMLAHSGIRLEETVAFGDSQNDITMLKHVGLGVAMGNAAEEVKQVADYITGTPEEDGIYNAMKKFGLV